MALASCVPAPYGSYLRPSYPDPSSKLSKAYCGGQAGPPTKLAFSASGEVAVTVSGREAAADRPLRFELTVRARTAQPWRLVEPAVRMTELATGETREEAFAQMHVSLRYPVPLDAELRGQASELSITVPMPQPRARRFL